MDIVLVIPPISFLMYLFVTEHHLKQINISIVGDPPINKIVFYVAKYLVVIVWAGMCLHKYGIGYSIFIYAPLQVVSIILWFLGFAGLFIGKALLGKNFRYGTPNEPTTLVFTGFYKVTRNPMYVSLHLTIISSILYTLDPVMLFFGLFIIKAHHHIILAEEQWMKVNYGRAYVAYCQHVRRYL